eukprot:scaffold9994_cov61-Phaeocystis_antarctica.AAC.1
MTGIVGCSERDPDGARVVPFAARSRGAGGAATKYTHSLSPSRPPNNTLNTQSRAQQTHSRSRSLRAHPHRTDPPSVMPRAARLGRRSWRACRPNAWFLDRRRLRSRAARRWRRRLGAWARARRQQLSGMTEASASLTTDDSCSSTLRTSRCLSSRHAVAEGAGVA